MAIQPQIWSNFPLFFIYGGKDLLLVPKDNKLRSHHNMHHNIHKFYVDNYAHLDFIRGMNAKHIVYDDVVYFIEGILCVCIIVHFSKILKLVFMLL